jgi:hypothetical protein
LVTTGAFAALFSIAYRHGQRATRPELWLWLAFVLSAWFLMTPLSGPLWHALPTLQKVQFPWRVAVILDFAVSTTAVLAMRNLGTPRNPWANAAAALSVGLVAFTLVLAGRSALNHLALSRNAAHQAEIVTMLGLGIDADEYIPHGVALKPEDVRDALDSMPPVRLVDGSGKLDVVRWDPRRIRLQAELEAPAEGVVRQFYFPGWRAQSSDPKREIAIDRVALTGVMRLRLPKGRYEIDLTLEHLREEKLGALFTLAGALGLTIVSFWQRARRRAAPPARSSGS